MVQCDFEGGFLASRAVLGRGSGAGKSWITTAFCAWLREQGVNVAPFKAQNMSNNAWVTFDGGEIGRAQAVQAKACGLVPSVQMNPILLKPSGTLGSQVIVLGKAQGHCLAADYYRGFTAPAMQRGIGGTSSSRRAVL